MIWNRINLFWQRNHISLKKLYSLYFKCYYINQKCKWASDIHQEANPLPYRFPSSHQDAGTWNYNANTKWDDYFSYEKSLARVAISSENFIELRLHHGSAESPRSSHLKLMRQRMEQETTNKTKEAWRNVHRKATDSKREERPSPLISLRRHPKPKIGHKWQLKLRSCYRSSPNPSEVLSAIHKAPEIKTALPTLMTYHTTKNPHSI